MLEVAVGRGSFAFLWFFLAFETDPLTLVGFRSYEEATHKRGSGTRGTLPVLDDLRKKLSERRKLADDDHSAILTRFQPAHRGTPSNKEDVTEPLAQSTKCHNISVFDESITTRLKAEPVSTEAETAYERPSNLWHKSAA
uniref:Secreted protein n=1 Tax=Ixodes ricinus TaxID=34613 RepID=A0A6B0UT78_IXORI